MELKIERLSKTYANGVHALRDVSLAIPQGMFGLLGPNGAGKSTLMRILATLQEPDSGSVRLGEIDVVRDKDRVRGLLGYLPQEFGLYPKVEALPLLEHFALLKGVGERRERRRVAEALLRQTNLWDARHKRLGGFSGGMRQRFGIAIALIGSPRLIIVDEPTAGLDPAERVRFLNLLSEIGENAVVILSTHIVEDVAELCSHMAIINHGHILLEADPLAAIARLRGRVWRRVVGRAELAAVEASHTVISTKLLSGRTVVRVVADAHPGEGFEPAEPDLEDVYFSVMHAIPLDAPTPPAPVELSPAVSPDLAAESTDGAARPSSEPEPEATTAVTSSADHAEPVAATPGAGQPPSEAMDGHDEERDRYVDVSLVPPSEAAEPTPSADSQLPEQGVDRVAPPPPLEPRPEPELEPEPSVDVLPPEEPDTVMHSVSSDLPAPPAADAEVEPPADDPQSGLVFDNATLPLFPGTPAEVVDEPRSDAAGEGQDEPAPAPPEDADQLGLFADTGPGAGVR